MLDYQFVHPDFRLNGFSFTAADLQRVAYAYIKEGDEHEQAIGLFLLHWFDSSESIALTTSGTTGYPKKIQLSKQAMVASAQATGEFFQLGASSKALLCLSAQFIAGKMMLVRALQLGWALDVVEPNTTPLQKCVTTYDFAAMVPLQVAQSFSQLAKIKTLLIGGAPLAEKTRQQLIQLGVNVYESYGMTETITHIALKSVRETYFTALPGVEFSVNENQCLRILVPRIAANPIQTNDVVQLHSTAQFEFLGRFDSVINSGGVKLFPELIEQKIAQFIPHRFYVVGQPDEKWGERVVLVIESAVFELPKEVEEVLTKYEKPKAVFFQAKLEETATGKIKRLVPN